MAAAPETSAEYIKHHLTNLTFGIPEGHDTPVTGVLRTVRRKPPNLGFWAINVDSMLFSIGLGVLFLWSFRLAAKTATTDVPGALAELCRVGDRVH